ncbi:hypothetical protein NL532_24135 [Mesorhizobium sp. C120A]|uniref:hypothetical protein n=1 Tax=unclassified Mesorhizobium TaxID=325217 RepID=UPI0003D01784|nr:MULTISPECIES: hypothetical protein [unclassified Mesorhizobium]ESZ60663.1 hypothetical protein X728_15090 [Mesorhizobium sp. L103C120A0]WJI43699.1 hypothetical protein NL532_24135 [Mesorhizobium sp. C120A]
MANVFITEYARLGADLSGKIVLAGFEPAAAEQVIANPVASTQSSVLNASTTFVMIHVDAAAHVKFGTNPTAVTTAGHMSAGETRFYGVQPNQAIKIAAINGA